MEIPRTDAPLKNGLQSRRPPATMVVCDSPGNGDLPHEAKKHLPDHDLPLNSFERASRRADANTNLALYDPTSVADNLYRIHFADGAFAHGALRM